MCISKYLVLLIVQLVYCKNIPQNNSAVLISKYSKVQRYGPASSSTGRSNGQSLWTHRSDANVVSGQNVKKEATIYYGISKKSDVKKEIVPGIGEVTVQERFNPKPYFEYSQIPPKNNGNIKAPNPPPSSIKSPVYQPPPAQPSKAPPTVNLYTSPYSSYNPPPAPISGNSKDNSNNYPPLDSSNSKDTYAAPPPPPSDSGSYYQPEKASSLGPPLAPSYDMDNYFKVNDEGPESQPQGPAGPDDDHFEEAKNSKGPNRPPKSEDDIYYPPDDKETILDHPPAGYKPDMAEDDLSPPPSAPHAMHADAADDSHAFHDQPRFPQYLYDHPHYDDHHIYEEVSPPSTTPKAEDERVNKGHFSYYHLGRKLWYIPLYFSVYFIIYITVLILKSIARHKIEFKHNLHDHFHRKARGMDLNNGDAEPSPSASTTLDHLHRNVTNGIYNFQKRYQNSFMK